MCTPNQKFIQDFDPRGIGCELNLMGVTKSCSQPITNRGSGVIVSTESSVSCLQHENIGTDT